MHRRTFLFTDCRNTAINPCRNLANRHTAGKHAHHLLLLARQLGCLGRLLQAGLVKLRAQALADKLAPLHHGFQRHRQLPG